jgi:fumarate reductase flavoprotein subunit
VPSRNQTWDVIVVGGGTAGLACAIAAAAAGARVCVLERDSEVGGTLHVTAGQMSAASTRQQERLGIEDSWQEHFDDVMRIGRHRNDPDLVRLAVQEASGTLDWLEELGFDYFDGTPLIHYGMEPYSTARTTWGTDKGLSILRALLPVFEDLVSANRISLFLRHRLAEVALHADEVIGVIAESPDGLTEFRGDATVLCTGGYASNPVLFAELHPGVHCLLGARATSTGDGLLAARRVGATVRGADCHLPTYGCLPCGAIVGRTDVTNGFGNLSPQYRAIREIVVNSRGQRFFAEDASSYDVRQRALVAQGGKAWIVFDDSVIDEAAPLIVGWSRRRLQEEAAVGRRVWLASDPVLLARRAGIEPEGLCRTLLEYNAGVRIGCDSFGRTRLDRELLTAPYYAIALQSGIVLSFGGLTVDSRLRVMNQGGTPIPGLYAAGEILGAGALMGNAYSGGMCLTPALSLGRLLGRQLAMYAAAQRAVR